MSFYFFLKSFCLFDIVDSLFTFASIEILNLICKLRLSIKICIIFLVVVVIIRACSVISCQKNSARYVWNLIVKYTISLSKPLSNWAFLLACIPFIVLCWAVVCCVVKEDEHKKYVVVVFLLLLSSSLRLQHTHRCFFFGTFLRRI